MTDNAGKDKEQVVAMVPAGGYDCTFHNLIDGGV